MVDMQSFSPPQIRAARAILDWSLEDLAVASGLTRGGLNNLERGTSRPHQATTDKLLEVFGREGIIFTDGDGVRRERDGFRVLEGPDPYLELLDDAFRTLQRGGGEILYFYVDNEKSPQTVIDSDLRMRHAGITSRFLIDETKPYCLFPLKEYRCVPHEDFHNNTIVVYSDKVGVMIDGNASCHLVKNASYASTMRAIFDRLWKTHKMPAETIAPVTYE
jgi:transcriptional regulator with XRE-family HTH domain